MPLTKVPLRLPPISNRHFAVDERDLEVLDADRLVALVGVTAPEVEAARRNRIGIDERLIAAPYDDCAWTRQHASIVARSAQLAHSPSPLTTSNARDSPRSDAVQQRKRAPVVRAHLAALERFELGDEQIDIGLSREPEASRRWWRRKIDDAHSDPSASFGSAAVCASETTLPMTSTAGSSVSNDAAAIVARSPIHVIDSGCDAP